MNELARVLTLPRRVSAPGELVDALSAYLRIRPDPTCPDGPGTADDPCQRCGGTGLIMLRQAQADALLELLEIRGLVAPMKVGSGKTLVTLLAPTLLGSQRPALVVPGSCQDKTRRDFAALRRDWRVRLPNLFSYEGLGQPQQETRLLELAPDLLVLDEAHRVRHLDTSVTRRIERCIARCRPVVACLSGTLITDKLLDYHHHTVWSLGAAAPVPVRVAEAERWAAILDRDRIVPEPDLQIPGGFHEWFRGSRGIIVTPGSDCTASIEISTWQPTLPPGIAQVIREVEASKARPDGELLDEWEAPDCQCQLVQGFFYRWDPAPPSWWLTPRRGWRGYARMVLDERIEGFDSESQIVRALDRTAPERAPHVLPPAPDEGRRLLAAWREVRDRFVPNPVPVWLDVSVLEQAVARAGKGTLIWTRHRAPGRMLEAMGVPYYDAEICPETAPPGRTIACSIPAHGTGKNLQYGWHRNLVLTPMAKPDLWEQLIGRTHRPGQKNDTVSFDIVRAIDYHKDVLDRVLRKARATSRDSGFSQKLVEATWI